MKKPIRQVWTFRSDSNPRREYETLQYMDGTTSCACPGWTRRVAADGTRSCKHTRWVDQGSADRHCIDTHHYTITQPRKTPQSHARSPIKIVPQLGHRRFAL